MTVGVPETGPLSRWFTLGLVYTALSTSILSSLGLLLIPPIATAMDVPVSTAQWMLTINMMVGAISTPILGRLADGAHTKRLLIVLLLIIVVGSVIAATSVNFGVLLLGRALQGVSFGIIPIAITLVRRYEQQGRIERGIASLSVTAVTGAALGYPLTGIIASAGDFRVAFWFAAVFVLTTLVVVWRLVPADPPVAKKQRQPFDYPGAILLGVGLGLLLLGISEGPVWGWSSWESFASFGASLIALASWMIVELRTKYPLIRFAILRQGDVIVANAAAISINASMFTGMSVLSILSQATTETGFGLAMPLVWAGFVMAPSSLGSFVATYLSRRISGRWSWSAVLPVGAFGVTVASTFLWAFHSQIWQVLVGSFLFGTAIGMVFAAMPAMISQRVETKEIGSAVSFNAVLRIMGGSMGSAISAAIIASHLNPATMQPTPDGINTAFLASAIMCALVCCALVVNIALRRSRRSAS